MTDPNLWDTQRLSFAQTTRTVATALVTGQQIGAVEASIIAGQVFITQSSWNLVNVNVCHRDKILARPIIVHHDALNESQDEATALNNTVLQGCQEFAAMNLLKLFLRVMSITQ